MRPSRSNMPDFASKGMEMKHTENALWTILTWAVILGALSMSALAAPGDQPNPTDKFKNLEFREIGPATMGGRIDDFAVVESNPNIVYVGTASGGVWKTTNNGTTWEPIFDKESVSTIGDIAIAPSDPSVVWVGTGEPNNRQSSSWGDGAYKSLDGGKTWKKMGLEATRHIGRIVILRMNHDSPDVARGLQPHLLPGLPAVERLVRSIAPGGALPVVRLSCPDPHHRGVRRRNRNVANRRHALFIEYRLPRGAVVSRFPHAPRSRAHVHDVRIALHDCEIVDAPAHRRGANLAEFQILELIGGIWLVAGHGQRAHRQRAKNRRTSQNRPPSIPCMLHFHPPVCKARLITPAGPHSASNVLKEQTNPLQRQTCRPTAPFHDSVIPLIAALSRHATRAPALALKSLRPHARLSNCFH